MFDGTELWWSNFRSPRTAAYAALRGLFSHRRSQLFWSAPKLLKGLERETGFEPATSSLGNRLYFENEEEPRLIRLS